MIKLNILCPFLLLSALFIFGSSPSLEARHHKHHRHHKHFSVNFGPIFYAQPAPCIIEKPPVYVQERFYYSPCAYSERIYIQPAPKVYAYPVYAYPARPVSFTGFSLGFNFFR